jgi:hypothetical protein
MGIVVEDGRLCFHRLLVRRNEFLADARSFKFYDLDGQQRILDLDPGTLAFTTCQVPVVAHRSGPQRIEITRAEGSGYWVEGLDLDAENSAAVFERTGAVRCLDVFLDFVGGV